MVKLKYKKKKKKKKKRKEGKGKKKGKKRKKRKSDEDCIVLILGILLVIIYWGERRVRKKLKLKLRMREREREGGGERDNDRLLSLSRVFLCPISSSPSCSSLPSSPICFGFANNRNSFKPIYRTAPIIYFFLVFDFWFLICCLVSHWAYSLPFSLICYV